MKLTPEEIKEIESKKDLALLKIKKARVQLLQHSPFYSSILLSMPIEFNYTWCKTAAIVYGEKQHRLVFNPEFITGIGEVRKKVVTQRIKDSNNSQEEKIRQLKQIEIGYNMKTEGDNLLLLCHEVAHRVNEHFIRGLTLDQNLLSKAQDYAINLTIAKELFGTYEKAVEEAPVLKTGCFDVKYEGWTSEKIYADLEQKGQKGASPTLDQHPGEGKGGEGSFDDHMGFEESMPSMSGAEEQEANEKFQDMARSSAQAAQMAGDCPSHIADRYLKIEPYKVKWENVLKKRIRSLFKENTSYQRPSRRSFSLTNKLRHEGWIEKHRSVVLPGKMNTNHVGVCVAVDTSGSLSDDNLSKILSEIVGIERSVNGNLSCNIFEWNSKASNKETFSGSNVRKIKEWRPKTSGGTSVSCAIDYVREHFSDTKTVVIATDGYFFDKPDSAFGKEFDVIWLVQGNPNFSCEFGKILHLD